MQETQDKIAKDDLVLIRPKTSSDESFIFATWLRGLRHGNDMFKLIPADTYYRSYHKAIERILTAPNTRVQVACLKESPEIILGYAVTNGDTLHWVHVKKAWRGIGIAKSLMPDTGVTSVTHVNKLGVSYLHKHPSLVFNPFNVP